jgi:hypothetical protein
MLSEPDRISNRQSFDSMVHWSDRWFNRFNRWFFKTHITYYLKA